MLLVGSSSATRTWRFQSIVGEALGWMVGDFVVDEMDKDSLMGDLDASDD